LSRLGLVLKFPESKAHEISVSSLMSEPSEIAAFLLPFAEAS
jgi:hypothetical protein